MKYSEFITLVISEITPGDHYICHALRKTLAANKEQQANAKKLISYIENLLKEEYRLRIAADPTWEGTETRALCDVLTNRYGRDCDLAKARIALLTKYAAYHAVRGN